MERGGTACQWFCEKCRKEDDIILPGVEKKLNEIHVLLCSLLHRMDRIEEGYSDQAMEKKNRRHS